MQQLTFAVTLPLLFLLLLAGASPWSFAQVPQSRHVVIVVEENHSYSSVIGNTAMPYLNSLANSYASATNYYGNTHPSIGNYFMMTTGQIITNNDSYSQVVTADNIVRHLLSGGKTWKAYAESLPSVGYTGGDTGQYTKHHNPFPYFSDVVNSNVQRLNLVPFTQFATDLANNNLPDYAFIVPNRCNDAHDCSLTTADNWLKAQIALLISNPVFQQNGILFITFDESTSSDTAHGGGHIATVVVSPKVKRNYRSITFYQHQSLLKTTMTALGLNNFPGAAASAAAMSEFFTGSTSTPSFTMSASPTTKTIARGGTASYTVKVSPLGGFTGAVALSIAGLPSGAKASFSPSSINTSGSATLEVSTSRANNVIGNYALKISGTVAGLTSSTQVALLITKR